MGRFRSESKRAAEDDMGFMRAALEEACAAERAGELPVGAVIVCGGEVIAKAANRTEERGNALSHAELNAITAACGALGKKTLEGCSLYVTLEPCPMCAGAIINSRIPTVVFGAKDENTGSCGSVINLFEERYGHKPAIYGGVRAEESARLLKEFFKKAR